MEVIHTIWDTKNLHIWAESSELLRNVTLNEPELTLHDKDHPYAVSFSRLLQILKQVKQESNDEKYNPNWLVMKLPSFKTIPQPSPILDEVSIPRNESVIFNHWQINTLDLHASKALNFLVSIPPEPPEGLEFSDSFKFWQLVAKFAVNLISKGSYLPYLKIITRSPELTKFEGTWKAIILGQDKDYLVKLISNIPKYCLFFNQGQNPQEEIVLSFIDQTIDTFLKSKINVFIPNQTTSEMNFTVEIAKTWFESLYKPNSDIITTKTTDFDYFFGLLKAWLHDYETFGFYTKFRTCFKLEPPSDEEPVTSGWKLQIFLQNEKDENLIIPASDIWKYQIDTIGFLEQRFENPQERLLSDLGKAEQIYPKINDCLQSVFPSELSLSFTEALDFLTDYIKPLEDNGFNIYLPSWWDEPEKAIGIELDITRESDKGNSTQSLFSLTKLVDFDWKFSIDGQTLSREEFEQLASLKVPFVRLRGKWVKINQEELAKTVEFFREKFGKLTFRDLIEIDALLEEDATLLPYLTLPEENLEYKKFSQLIKRSKLAILQQPEQFLGELRPYQITGFSWLDYLRNVGFGACLADDMGLGKTIQIIALLLKMKEESSVTNTPVLLICPTSILGNWFKELERFGPSIQALIHHGPNRISGPEFEETVMNYDIIITTYNLAHRDFDDLSNITWSTVILDESQNIKNPNTKQSRAIRKLKGNFMIAMTGTPIENRLLELWTLMDFLNPGYLNSRAQFNSHFVEPIEKGYNDQKARMLAKLIQPFVLRRLKTDPNVIKDLPEKIESKVYCSLTEEQTLLYEAVVRDMLERIDKVDGFERKGMILSALTKLKQICNHPAHFMHDYSEPFDKRSGKINRLLEMLEEVLANDEKALIFTQYTEFGQELQIYLEKVYDQEVLFLYGGIRQKNRDKIVQRFQENTKDSPNLFILSIKAGGVGLNLTAANHVFHIDRWWNPSVENQATDRAHRIGQLKNVFVHKFINIGTLEENIDQLIERKMNLADSIIGTGDSWITELSIDDLRQLLSLKSIMDRS